MVADRTQQNPARKLGTSQKNRGKEMSDVKSIWSQADNVPLIPYLNNEQRADLVNSKTIVSLTHMDYEPNAQYGARFVATFQVPETGDAYHFAMKSSAGKSPRDHVNKAMWEAFKRGHEPIECQLVKKGSAYMLAEPGSETDYDGQMPRPAVGTTDEPPF